MYMCVPSPETFSTAQGLPAWTHSQRHASHQRQQQPRLDAGREDSLRELLTPWLEGRTVVMAAHRGGLVGRVDRTLSLVAGRLVETEVVVPARDGRTGVHTRIRPGVPR